MKWFVKQNILLLEISHYVRFFSDKDKIKKNVRWIFTLSQKNFVKPVKSKYQKIL